MKKYLLVIAFFACISISQSLAQSFSDRVILHKGYFFGMHDGQRTAITHLTTSGDDSVTQVGRIRRTVQFGLNWGTSVLLFAINDEQSIRLSASLAGSIFTTIGFSEDPYLDDDLGFALQIPLVLNYHIGHIATKNSLKDHGFNIGLGVEITRLSSDNEQSISGFSSSYFYNRKYASSELNSMQPVLSLGYNYWNARDLVRSLNLQVGFGSKHELAGVAFYRPSVRLSLHRYIKY